MSTPVTPTSPKAADARLPAVQKEYEVPRTARQRAADTIDDTIPYAFHSDSTAESSGILSCVQNFACSIWSCVSDFFGRVANLFSSARDNPELLANPLKQIDADLAIWKDSKGPMTKLVNEVRKGSQDAVVKLSFHFTAFKKESSYSSGSFCRQHPEPIHTGSPTWLTPPQ